ncbi:hypothetical protein [Rhizobium sp. BK376]|uniref:hypothetical protein n=1 Tax=Rhizobium sp. BK376 TaxID=2512149 RepID=UPI001048CE4A|nr:hypothetical protein [Rhizobium sp. BK376]TCR70707.1 hypothetical protein EV561_13819 [Rhizobium sp. BK376]
MAEEQSLNSVKISLIDNSAYIPSILPEYVVLGFLDEYMGRINLGDDDYVERFYPAEEPLVKIFAEYLKVFAITRNIKTTIKITIGPHGHHYVTSAEIAKYINDTYGDNYIDSLYNNARGISEAMFSALSDPHRVLRYDNEPVDCRFSYLLGAYMRYGSGNGFQLANSGHKIDLIITFLERLGAKWVSKVWSVGGAPRIGVIRFGPDEVLARLFGIAPSGWDFPWLKHACAKNNAAPA